MIAELDVTALYSNDFAALYSTGHETETLLIPEKAVQEKVPEIEETPPSGTSVPPIWRVASSADSINIIKFMEYLQAMFARAEFEDFEDGVESQFHQELSSTIFEFGNFALASIAYMLNNYEKKTGILCEALKMLGVIEHLSTHRNRLSVLEKYLRSSSDYVRDAASLGIASMDDPRSIPALEEAVRSETNDELKDDLQLVLDQLIETQQCLTS